MHSREKKTHCQKSFHPLLTTKKKIIYSICGLKRRLQLTKPEETCNNKNAKDYEKQMKIFHDEQIIRKSFILAQKVLLFISLLQVFLGKLRPQLFDPFIIHTVFPYWAIKIKNLKNNVTLKVNGKKLKPYLEYRPHGENIKIDLSDPPNLYWNFFHFF